MSTPGAIPEIGFLGLGAMGLPMAERLIDGGHKLIVYDIRANAVAPLMARGATSVSSVRALVERCETIVLSLPDLVAVRQVLLMSGDFRAGGRLRTAINTCTIGATLAEEISLALGKAGIELVDCPISGGPAGARAGSLSVMVSGSDESMKAVMPILGLWGKSVTVAGDRPGMAQVLKLVNNILAAVAIVATSEAMVMGAKAGLAPDVMIKAVNAGVGRNGATLSVFPAAVLPRSFDFGSPIDMLMKDVDLAIAQGESLGVPMWVCQAARLVIKHTQFAGRGSEDITTLIKTIERGADFELPPSTLCV